jgi:glucose/arabinose dehydrogenase
MLFKKEKSNKHLSQGRLTFGIAVFLYYFLHNLRKGTYMFRFMIGIAIAVGITSTASAMESSVGKLNVTTIVDGLEQPWAFAVLPKRGVLITEREGALLYINGDQRFNVRGVPKVWAEGQGGLLDITLPRDFETSREIFLTYAKPQGKGAGTALAVARLSKDGKRLTGLKDLFISAPVGKTGRHFGSRVVEAKDGSLFVTIGDRGDRPSAQDRSNHNGAIVRVTRNGKVPADNPFVGKANIQPEIWSYGHRNPQGAALDARGQLWTAEHGAKGGDEVNLISKGANFGWPVISYGVHYSGDPIGDGVAKEGMEQPTHYWDPSIAPSGLSVYSGNMFKTWNGDLLVGSLKFDYISRLSETNGRLTEVETLKSDETDRVRDIQTATDGSIWFLSAGNGALYRINQD